MKLTDWPTLAHQNTAIVAVEYHTPERMQILQQFYPDFSQRTEQKGSKTAKMYM